MDRCSFPDCNRKIKARGLCQTHYMRYRRGADIPAPITRVHERPIGFWRVRTDGYVDIKVGPGSNGYRLEHRVIAAEMLGRPLTDDEQVHHINGVRDDNRPENLQVLTNAEHQKLHDHLDVQHPPITVTLTCHGCGVEYQQKPSRTTSKYCSNKCRLPALHQGNRKR